MGIALTSTVEVETGGSSAPERPLEEDSFFTRGFVEVSVDAER
jgi:hypothetical protein